jgi:exodeoxyribonuclease III
MRVITLNLNGIRSATTKGLWEWLSTQDADIICLQEVRAQEHQLPDLEPLGLNTYHAHWNPAERPGYSGVGILSKLEPNTVTRGFGSSEFDGEGRTIRADFDAFSVMSAYLPSGSSGEDRQAAKYRFLDAFLPHLEMVRNEREVLVCGDFNIAHRKVDIKNWRSNQNSSGFLPEERAWMDDLLSRGWRDVFREHVGADAEIYSWWSNRGRARENDVGWRIDYQMGTSRFGDAVRGARVYRERFFSDHAPVIVDYEWS